MSTAFDDLDDNGKLEKLLHHLSKPGSYPVPADWVRWFLKRHVLRTEMLERRAAYYQDRAAALYARSRQKRDENSPEWANFCMVRAAVMSAKARACLFQLIET